MSLTSHKRRGKTKQNKQFRSQNKYSIEEHLSILSNAASVLRTWREYEEFVTQGSHVPKSIIKIITTWATGADIA